MPKAKTFNIVAVRPLLGELQFPLSESLRPSYRELQSLGAILRATAPDRQKSRFLHQGSIRNGTLTTALAMSYAEAGPDVHRQRREYLVYESSQEYCSFTELKLHDA